MEVPSKTVSDTSSGIEMYLFPEKSPEEFLIALIEKYGSVELAVCVSAQHSSRKMIGALHAVTNGFLLMNIVYLDKQSIRIPQPSERAYLYKNWTLPVRWLAPGAPPDNEKESRSSPENPLDATFDLLLGEHGIKAMLIAADNAFTARWMLVGSGSPLEEHPAKPAVPNRRGQGVSDRRRSGPREEANEKPLLHLFRLPPARDNGSSQKVISLDEGSGQKAAREIVAS
ncbi:MAG: hypothetical protein ACYDBP_00040 [Leptospirales bacterium]